MPNFIPKQYQKDPITIRIESEKLDKIDKLARMDLLETNMVEYGYFSSALR
ncbi:MAG: hypothetical protein NC122_06490 [Faecalibacterium sp.]|nr:hypothetical protein [Ruminococcus sp.]MCM1392870.1 hypothetical protein [Ruminococcus sp.]MCM1485840.1 hypothetical protein [Faecalibacterium sp.]